MHHPIPDYIFWPFLGLVALVAGWMIVEVGLFVCGVGSLIGRIMGGGP